MHRNDELVTAYFREEIVVVDFLTLKRVIGSTLNWVSVRSCSARHKVCDAAVFMPLIIVNVTGENHDSSANGLLSAFENHGHVLLWRTCRVPSSEFLAVR